MLNNLNLCRHKFYNRFQMSPCIKGYGENIVYESKNCYRHNLYTFLLNNQKLFLSVMSAFLFAVNRLNMKYGEEVKLTKSEKLLHSYKVLNEWPSAREQLYLEKIYNSEHGIHLGDKLWKNQQYNALKIYDSLCANSGDILENILEWEGSFGEFSNETVGKLPIFPSSTLVQTNIATLWIFSSQVIRLAFRN